MADKDLEEMYKEHIGNTEIMFWVYEQKEQDAQQILKKRPRSPSAVSAVTVQPVQSQGSQNQM